MPSTKPALFPDLFCAGDVLVIRKQTDPKLVYIGGVMHGSPLFSALTELRLSTGVTLAVLGLGYPFD